MLLPSLTQQKGVVTSLHAARGPLCTSTAQPRYAFGCRHRHLRTAFVLTTRDELMSAHFPKSRKGGAYVESYNTVEWSAHRKS